MPRLKSTPDEIEKYLALIAETPRSIASAAAGLDNTQLHQSPGGKSWSAADILAHLRACDDLWMHSVFAMLTHDNPALPLIDERRWAKTTRYAPLDFHSSLQVFTLKRDELLHVLRNLPEAAWSRTAVIEGRTHSVFSQVRRMALHEAEHCQQIAAMLNEPPGTS